MFLCLVFAAFLRATLWPARDGRILSREALEVPRVAGLQAGNAPYTTGGAAREGDRPRVATQLREDTDGHSKSLLEWLEADAGAQFDVVLEDSEEEVVGPDGEEISIPIVEEQMAASLQTLDLLDRKIEITFWWREEFEEEWHQSGSGCNERQENDHEPLLGESWSFPTSEFPDCEMKIVYEAFDASHRPRFRTERFYRTRTPDSPAR